MWIRIAIIGAACLIVVWIVTKSWREKHNVRIEYKQFFLRFFRLIFRFISPIVIIRWLLKHPVALKNIRNFHPGKDYLIGFVSIGFVSLP